MFGWLSRRRLREQKMLLWQNGFAASVMAEGSFFDQPEIARDLKRLEEENRIYSEKAAKITKLSIDDLDRLLEINKMLRSAHDMTASRHIEKFDETFKPMMGWKWVTGRND